MKTIIYFIFLIFTLPIFSQYTEETIAKVYINKAKLDTINKIGRVSIYPFFYNYLNSDEITHLNKIIGNQNNQNKTHLRLNYKITKDGRVTLVKDCKGLIKKSLPEELKGIPEFDGTDVCNNKELIDYLNHYFASKRIIFKFFTNRESKEEIKDLTKYSDYLFNFEFGFYLMKNKALFEQSVYKKKS